MEYLYNEIKPQLEDLIKKKKSFVIIGLKGELLDVSAHIEQTIEAAGLTCRIYTRNRTWAAGAIAWTGAGILSLAAIAAHNVATFNPDYEIGRCAIDNKIYVDYKK